MLISVLKSKIHRVTVTGSEIDYEGSCGIDSYLLRSAGIREYEKIHIYNVTNGERFVTYAIAEPAGSAAIVIRGAAAHKAAVGDTIIIAAYALIDPRDDCSPIKVYPKNNKL